MPRQTNPLPQLGHQRLIGVMGQVKDLIWSQRRPLPIALAPLGEGISDQAAAARQEFTPLADLPVHIGAGGWGNRWCRVEVPAAGPGEEGHRHLEWTCSGEATVWLDGEAWSGIDHAHPTCPLPERACSLLVEVCLWNTGLGGPKMGPVDKALGVRLEGAWLALRDEMAWEAFHDLDVLAMLFSEQLRSEGLEGPLHSGTQPDWVRASPLLRRLAMAIEGVCDAWVAAGLTGLRAAAADLLRAFPAETWQPAAALVGHSHLDCIWLWPEAATRRKMVHTTASMLRLMERYGEFRFLQSQPYLYDRLGQDAPGLLSQVQQRIREGRWEATGGFVVEPDTYLPCGEALARSLVLGQRRLSELRGGPSRLCWIPDVFGYASCLPQLLRLAGITGFYTTKLAWRSVTRFPYTSFRWRGSDGSEVITHLGQGYNCRVEVRETLEASRLHRQVDVHPVMLIPTGQGDGSGGTRAEDLERARRLASLAGVPRHRWCSGEAEMAALETVGDRLPVYEGELSIEYHRGTYTSQARFKRAHRALERALQVEEAARVAGAGGPVDGHAWQRLCLAQFHDAIPGSSIGLVYEQLGCELERLAGERLVAAQMALGGAGGRWFNPLPMPRRWVAERDGRCDLVELPALAVADPRPVPTDPVRVARGSLDNGRCQARFDAEGRLAGLVLDGWTAPLAGPCRLDLYHDHPKAYDAWDIDHYTLRRPLAAGPALVLAASGDGTVRGELAGEAPLGERSRLHWRWLLEAGSAWLRCELRIDWRERHRLLKFHLPTLCAGREARFGTAFGAVDRCQVPMGAEAEAAWEVPASRWAAVRDRVGDGLALVSEASYGFSCRDGDLGLSLLRSPTHPDPEADQGEHLLRFAIGRHRDVWEPDAAPTAAQADLLFTPPLAVAAPAGSAPIAWRDLGGLVPAWVEPLADGCLLRLHEVAGRCGTARLSAAGAALEVVDLLGKVLSGLGRGADGLWEIPYRPFQVLGLRLRA